MKYATPKRTKKIQNYQNVFLFYSFLFIYLFFFCQLVVSWIFFALLLPHSFALSLYLSLFNRCFGYIDGMAHSKCSRCLCENKRLTKMHDRLVKEGRFILFDYLTMPLLFVSKSIVVPNILCIKRCRVCVC